MAKAISIDIESLSLKTNCVILQVGFCVFDTRNLDVPEYEYSQCFNSQEQVEANFAHDEETKAWWHKKNAGLYLRLYAEGMDSEYSLAENIETLYQKLAMQLYCWPNEPMEIWARGPQFDCNALANLFAYVGLAPPWKHNMVRDSRTLYAIGGFKEQEWNEAVHGEQHDALNDAKKEASDIQMALHLVRLAGVRR